MTLRLQILFGFTLGARAGCPGRGMTAPKPGTYELAGDAPFTMAKFADAIARQSGQPVAYKDLPEAEYKAALLGAGLPGFLTDLVSQSSASAANGALDDDSHTLSRLIGRPTTPLRDAIAAVMRG